MMREVELEDKSISKAYSTFAIVLYSVQCSRIDLLIIAFYFAAEHKRLGGSNYDAFIYHG